jgi:osmotically-inducible protein OsmY
MHNLIETSPSRWRPYAVLGVVVVSAVASVALVACDRQEPSQSSGQRTSSPTAAAEPRSPSVTESVKSAAGEVAQKTEQAAADVGNAVKDAAITTAVNAQLAADSRLSAMRIDVDTVNGRVVLRGSAPDANASERARQLAASVDGVVSVDNQLVVGGKG